MVFLRNLVVIGAPGASSGINISNIGFVHIVNCLVRGISGGGIEVNGAETEIDHVIVQGNSDGISFGSSTPFHARVTNSQIDDNLLAGIDASPSALVVVANTSMTGNGFGARAVSVINGNKVDVTLDHCDISGNNVGVFVHAVDANGDAVIRLFGCVISYNVGAGVQGGPGFVFSYGNNGISANNPDFSGIVLSPLPLQ